MSTAYSISVSGDLLTRAAKIGDGASLMTRLGVALKTENALTVSHIQQKYMSFPKDQPPTMDGLRVQSNRLRNSLRASDPVTEGGQLSSGIGSNVVYAAIQEFGGQTSAHDIVARNGKALAFNPGTGQFFTKDDFSRELLGLRGNVRKSAGAMFVDENGICFRKSVRHPGSDIPARQYIQRGIEDRLADYTAAFNQEIQKTLS